MASLRGQKEVGPRPDWSPLGGLIQNFRRTSPPLSYGRPPKLIFARQSADHLTVIYSLIQEGVSTLFR